MIFKVESRNDQTFKLEPSFKVKKVCVVDDMIQNFWWLFDEVSGKNYVIECTTFVIMFYFCQYVFEGCIC